MRGYKKSRVELFIYMTTYERL